MAALLVAPLYRGRYSPEEKWAAAKAALKAYKAGHSSRKMLEVTFAALLTAPSTAELDGAASPPLRLLKAAFTGFRCV